MPRRLLCYNNFMDFSHILNTSLPQKDKLLAQGFTQKPDALLLQSPLQQKDFYTLITLDIKNQKLTAQVYETSTNEKYILFDVPSAHGAFVGKLREEVQALIEKIRATCFTSTNLYPDYINFLNTQLNAPGDTPWSDDGDTTSTVFRCPNQKWFALVMKIKFKNLGFASEEPVWAVNLKADPQKIPQLIDQNSIFPAYHMNKKYWITILLTAVTDFEKLCDLTRQSYTLVEKKK